MQKIKKFLEKNGSQLTAILVAFMAAGLLINISVWDFQANVLAGKKSAPFDGTVAPIKKVPNWVELSSTQWKSTYDQIPLDKFIDLPEYIPSQLTIPFSSLNLSNSTDKAIRNAQVTFSTPYMGNYKLDGQEYAGSHLAVDIKIPSGTPIYAIANGLVVKAASQSTGFGYNVVLRHDDVPSINDANVKTTYYSGYAHLSNYVVAEGDLVSKGQLIGSSGNSGTATTPHLHFQIDNDQAPWHLYWPFTSQDAAAAGVNFWDGVNVGLGKDKALATTISPMVYVQNYRNYQGSGTTSTNTTTTTTPVVTAPTTTTPTTPVVDELPPTTTTPVTTTPTTVVTQPTVDVKPAAAELAKFELKYNSSFSVNAPQVIKVIALDKDNAVIKEYQPVGEIYLKLENGSGALNKTYLSAADFHDGIAEFTVTPTAGFGIRVSVTNGSISQTTEVMQETTFADLNQTDENYVAINFLKENDIVRGYPDGTFKPENPVSRVESLKFIYEGLNKSIAKRYFLEFADTDSKAWYARYVASAQNDGVVRGYEGNLFKPANNVTKAEFVKMLMESAGFNIGTFKPVEKPFTDVETSAWYSGYIAVAKEKNLLDSSTNMFHPNEPMTRGEVSQILYKTILLKVSGNKKFESGLVVSANDLASFYQAI